MSQLWSRAAPVVLIGLCAPLLAVVPPAAAATTTEVTYFTADDDGDGKAGLYKRVGGAVALVEAESSDARLLSASGDGSRITYLSGPGAGHRGGTVVRDAGGRLIRVIGGGGGTVALNPGGTAIAFDVQWSEDAGTITFVYRADVATARQSHIEGTQDRGRLLGFADATHVLFATDKALVSIPLLGGTRTMVVGSAGLTPLSPASGAALSPDGTKIAFTVRGADAANPTAVVVASLSRSGETWTLGPRTTLATGGDNRSPTWTRDGTGIVYVHRDTPTGSGDLVTVPAAGGTAVRLSTPGNETSVAVVQVDDAGPGATTSRSALLQGSVAEPRWQLPAGADISGVILTRKLGSTVQKKVTVLAPLTSYVDAGLVVGQTYTYTAQPFDRSGNFGPGSVRTVTAMRVAPRAPDPTTNTERYQHWFPVTFADAAPGGARFTVDYRLVPSTVWQHWVLDQPGRVRTFGLSDPDPGVEPTDTSFGDTFQLQVTGTDGHGNVTPTVTTERVVVPHDNSSAVFSPGTGEGLRADRYHGDVQTLFASGHAATITLTGDRFQVIGERLPNGGRFVVYARTATGSWTRLSPTMDTYAATRQVRKVLYTHWSSTSQKRTYQVRWVPGPSATRKVVAIDAFAARR